MVDKTKKTSSKVDNDLNFDDLSDIGDDDFNFGEELEGGDNREPSRSKVAKELVKDAGTGLFESLIKKTTKDVLPDQYSASYHDAMDIYGFAGEVVDRNKEKLNKTMFKLGREAKKILPFKLSMLDKFLEDRQANYEAYRQQSEEEVRNAGIQSELTSIFDKQLDIQKALEARRDAKDDVGKKEQLVQAKMSSDILSNIDSNIAVQTSFTTEISKQFFRKSLEVQFKSYFVQADMLRTMRDSYKAFTVQFTNIEKNTSLPEFVKLKNTERLQDILRTQATQSVYNQLFENSKFVTGMKKRLAGVVDQKVDDITNTVDNFTDMLGNLSGSAEAGGSSPIAMIGSIASSMFGGTIGEKIASKIFPKIKDKIKDNKTINTGANYLNMLSNSPSTLIQSLREKAGNKAEELEDESSPGRWLGSKVMKGMGSLLDIASPVKPDTSVKQLGYLDHAQPAIFDNKVHRSITDVIPMYLARILKQNTDLTGMYQQVHGDKVTNPNSELLNYDFANRELKGDGEIKKNIETSVFGNKSTERRSKSISTSILSESRASINKSGMSLLDRKSAERSLKGSGSEKLLTSYIEEAKKRKGVSLTYDSLIANYEKNPTLQDIVNKNPQLKDLLDVIKNTKVNMPSYVDTSMKDLRSTYPIEGVKKLFLEVSKLARSELQHNLTDEVAIVFSKAFSSYILLTGRDVDSQSVVKKQAFSFMREDDLTDKVRNSLVVFMDDVKRVKNSDDILTNSSMEVLFGLMNYSIKQNINIDPSAYQTLSDLYPNMVQKGQLSIENIAEGKLTGQERQDYVSFESLSDITKLSKIELNGKRKEINYDNVIDKSVRGASEQLKKIADSLKATNGNPVAMMELVLKTAKEYKTTVSDKLKANYREVDKQFTSAFANMRDVTAKQFMNSFPIMIERFHKLSYGIDKRIEMLQIDMAERSGQMSKMASDISELSGSGEADGRIKNLDKAYTAYTNQEIKALKNVKRILERQIATLKAIYEDNPDVITPSIKRFRQSIADTLLEMKTTLNDLEAKGKQVELANL